LLPEGVDVATWFEPITFDIVDGLCDAEPLDRPCNEDPCAVQRTRLAVDFTLDVETVRIYSETTATLGPLRFYAFASYLDPGEDCPYGPWDQVVWTGLRPG
jgi:hypothetical protein